ncbi:tetratricopeptide repeat protein [Streptomyces sp. NPDC020845]|uniref:AfsR/SARP family transcriptional regulator n=1 Tax=Streptomyces sp. NPDC020845 TaxID=3365096 RepID=UPI00378E7AB0
MEFHILGTVELWDGQPRPLGSVKERIVLASLAVDIGRPVPMDTLLHRLWEDSLPQRARENLRTYVSRLRRRISVDLDAPTVTQRAHTYTLQADPQSVDLHRYLSLIAQARSLVDSGDDQRALRHLDEADEVWQGEPLAGLSGLWPQQVRDALILRNLAAAMVRAGIALRRGHFADLVGPLSLLTSQHPRDEAIAEHLMLALYGCGRATEALRIYQEVRRELVEELGSEPGQRLRHVQQSILRQVSVGDLIPGSANSHLQLHSTPPPQNLPRRVELVGRDTEMELIHAVLKASQNDMHGTIALEAIDGMSGVGKTALAIHVAYELRPLFPDGQVYLDLRAHGGTHKPLTPDAALQALLRILGVPSQRIPQDIDESTALWRSLLTQRRLLIILDDASGPEQVRPLLPGDSPSVVITTSRRRLVGLPGLQHLSLDVLQESDAIALFRQRVADERTRNTSEVAEIVRLCGYLPLAIEIMASRLNSHPSWSTSDLTYQLVSSSRRLAEFRDGYRAIARTFEFSYRWLTTEQQTAFRRLGLHTGSEFGLHAAASLTGLSLDETKHLLEDLLNHNLLQEPTPHRYRIHDLLREYARTLADTEEQEHQRELATGRLIDSYLYLADLADRLVYPHRPRTPVEVACIPDAPAWPDPAAARSWFTLERENLLVTIEQAWRTGPPHRAALFAHALGGMLDAERHGPTAETQHRQAITHWRSSGDQLAEARSLIDLSLTHAHAGDYPRAISSATRALELARAGNDEETAAEALHQLALPYRNQGLFKKALALQQEALDIRLRTAGRHQIARSQNNLGITYLHLGDYDTARVSFQAALEGFQVSGDRRSQALMYNNLGDLHLITENHDQARRSYERAMDLARSDGNAVDRAIIQMNLADILQVFGELDSALTLYRQTLAIFRDIGEKRSESAALNGIGTVLRTTGQHNEALAHHGRALEVAQQIGATSEEVKAMLQLGLTEYQLGRKDVATAHIEAALAIAHDAHAATETASARKILAAFRNERS